MSKRTSPAGHPVPTDYAGLLRAVWEAPDDDTPRLVFADYLDDRDGPGDGDRAAFIRAQVESAKTGNAERYVVLNLSTRKGWQWTPPRLLHFRPWAAFADRASAIRRVRIAPTLTVQTRHDGPKVVWHRGFPEGWFGFNVWHLAGAAAWLPVAEFAGLGRPRNPTGFGTDPDIATPLSPTARMGYDHHVSGLGTADMGRWFYTVADGMDRYVGEPGSYAVSRHAIPRFLGDGVVKCLTVRNAGGWNAAAGRIESGNPGALCVALSRAIGVFLYGSALMALTACAGGYGPDGVFWSDPQCDGLVVGEAGAFRV